MLLVDGERCGLNSQERQEFEKDLCRSFRRSVVLNGQFGTEVRYPVFRHLWALVREIMGTNGHERPQLENHTTSRTVPFHQNPARLVSSVDLSFPRNTRPRGCTSVLATVY